MKYSIFFLSVIIMNQLCAQLPSNTWVKQTGNQLTREVATDLEISNSEDIYVTGYYNDTAFFGAHTLISQGMNDVFLAKYASDGSCYWATSAGGGFDDYASELSLDAQGNIYVIGSFPSTIYFTNQDTETSSGGLDAYIAKYDANGNFIWTSLISGSADIIGLSITCDTINNFTYVSGYYTGSLILGNSNLGLVSLSGYDGFLAKLDNNGNFLTAKNITTPNGEDIEINALQTNSKGDVFLYGSFKNEILFDNVVLNTAKLNQDEPFLAKYNANMEIQWVKKMEQKPNDQYTGYTNQTDMAIDKSDHIYLTGYGTQDVILDSVEVVHPNNGYGIYIYKLNEEGNVLWGQNASGSKNDYFYCNGIDVNEKGEVFVTGKNEGTLNFTPYVAQPQKTLFIAKTDSEGNWTGLYTSQASSTGEFFSNVIGLKNDHIYVAGEFSGSVSLDNNTINSGLISDYNIFIAKFGDINAHASMQKGSADLITLYPNPSNDFIRIHSKVKIEKLFMYDLLAQEVLLTKQSNFSAPIKVHHLKPGLYQLIVFDSNNQHHILKFIKSD